MALEYSQYLENCLWPNFEPSKVKCSDCLLPCHGTIFGLPLKTTPAHLMSIVLMVNEKFKERVPAWEVPSACCICLCG